MIFNYDISFKSMLQWTLGNSSHRLGSIHFLDVIKSIASETLPGRDLVFEFLGSHWDMLKFRFEFNGLRFTLKLN